MLVNAMRPVRMRPPGPARAGRSLPNGFTLIELMVTLALVAILSLLAVPAFRTWIANSRVRAAGSDFLMGLRLAQTEALRRSSQTVFVLTNNANPGAAVTTQSVPMNGPNASGTATTTTIQVPAYTASTNGPNFNWAVSLAPSTLNNGHGVLVQAGSIADIGQAVTVTGPNAVCFNPMGFLATSVGSAANPTPGVTGATCAQASVPSGAASGPPVVIYQITTMGADHPLQIEVGLGGQVRLCNPAQQVSPTTPEGCQYPQQ